MEGCHEEVGTRPILYFVRTMATSIALSARDTDILVMLTAYFYLMACHKMWMKAWSAKKRKFISVHAIVEHLQMNPEVLEILPCFHALTASDITSYLAGHSKKTCWKFLRCSCITISLKALKTSLYSVTDHKRCRKICLQSIWSCLCQ